MTTSPSVEILPTFAASEVIWDQAGYAKSTSDSFVRLAVSSSDRSITQMPLHEVLDSTDEALEVFAKYCGAVVLPHAWGLVEAPDDQIWRLGDELGARTQHPDVPDGMLLAAKVERIISPHPLRLFSRKAVENLSGEYYETMRKTASTPYLFDMKARQLSVGRLASHTGKQIRILHDIEPRIAVNQ